MFRRVRKRIDEEKNEKLKRRITDGRDARIVASRRRQKFECDVFFEISKNTNPPLMRERETQRDTERHRERETERERERERKREIRQSMLEGEW